ncbi:hypothetical protein JP0016_01980 [Helicobacter pylori]
MQLVGISVSNLKEISSKEKFLWLNAKSFLIAGFIPFVMIPWLDFLNSLMLYVCFLLVFSIAEFFDEDISDILIAHSKIKTKTNHFMLKGKDMQQEIVVEEPNKITIAYNLEQTISKLKESVDLLEKNEQYNDAYALVCGIKSIVDEFHKDVTLHVSNNSKPPKRKRKSS